MTGSRQVPWVNTSFTGEFFFLTTEQLLASSRLGTSQLEQQLMALDTEIAKRQQAIDAETDLMHRQELELEQQRAKALEDAKRLEVDQLAEIQRQSLLALSANKAELDRKQALEKGMMQQQDVLARQAEQKRKDLELLEQQKMKGNSPQSRLELIVSMEQAVKDIRAQYDRTIESTRTELATAKQANVRSYKEVNPQDPWESRDDFNARVSGYERKLDAEYGIKIRGLETERDAKVQAIGLEGAKHSLEQEKFTVSAKVEVIGFNADSKEFELLVSSKDPFVPLVATVTYQIAGKTREELKVAYTRVDNAQKANALIGTIGYSLQESVFSIWTLKSDNVIVHSLLEGTAGNPVALIMTESYALGASNDMQYIYKEGVVTRGSLNSDIGPAGGYVFYDKGTYSDGWRYLEAAPASNEYSGKVWGGYGTSVGDTGTAIGTGKSNTEKIVAKFGSAEPYKRKTDYAAKLCADLVVTKDGVVYDDWFLPSKDELNLMYLNLQKNKLGGISGAFYWSSSEYAAYDAWNQYSINGFQNFTDRYYGYRVRPVRAY
jgi:hypothetical protein